MNLYKFWSEEFFVLILSHILLDPKTFVMIQRSRHHISQNYLSLPMEDYNAHIFSETFFCDPIFSRS